MMNDNTMNVADMIGAEEAASRAVEKRREELLEEQKKRKKKLVKTGSILTLISIVMVFATRSWFTMSREVSGTGANMTADDLPFELAVTGENIGAISYTKSGSTYSSISLNDMVGGIGAEDGDYDTYKLSGVDTTLYSAINSDTIIWRLTDTYDAKADGIGPDSSGSLSFYIIPRTEDGFTIKCSLQLDGYTAYVSKNIEEEDTTHDGTFSVSNLSLIKNTDSKYNAVNYLNRHMLFFKGGAKGSYTNLLDKDGFEISFTDEEITKNVPIKITVNWIWPKTFAQMACIAESGDIATNSETISEIRKYIVDDPEKLFDSNTISQADALLKMADAFTDDETDETTYTFNTTKAENNLVDLSNGYNVADSSIGKNIQYFLLRLSVMST